MNSIREQVVVAMVDALRLALPEYDVRRSRRRPVDVQDRPSASVNLVSEEAIDATLHDATEATATVEVVLAAMLDSESDLDPVVVNVHAALTAEDALGDLADPPMYTGAVWDSQENGDGLAIVCTLTFTATYHHLITDMAEPA